MRVILAAGLLAFVPSALAAQAAAQKPVRGSAYLSPMGEPFVAASGSAALGLWLATADKDRNNAISLAELTLDADRFFKRLDADSDGRIGGLEMTRYEEQIAPAALRAAAGIRPVGADKSRIPEGREPGDFRGQTEGRVGRDALPGGSLKVRPSIEQAWAPIEDTLNLGSIPQPVAMTDTDMSGSVTPDEFARAAARRFAQLDVNKNGQLDSGELSRPRR